MRGATASIELAHEYGLRQPPLSGRALRTALDRAVGHPATVQKLLLLHDPADRSIGAASAEIRHEAEEAWRVPTRCSVFTTARGVFAEPLSFASVILPALALS